MVFSCIFCAERGWQARLFGHRLHQIEPLCVIRPVHPFPSVTDIIQSIPASAACFAKLDATHGYFQIPLDEEASRLTTFILPSGRYRYLRAPMGLSSSSDEWCRHSDRVVEGMPWCKKIVDDILIWASNPSELESLFNQVVQRCEDLHVTLSRSKFHIDSTLKFAGCVVSALHRIQTEFLLWQSFRLLLTRLP